MCDAFDVAVLIGCAGASGGIDADLTGAGILPNSRDAAGVLSVCLRLSLLGDDWVALLLSHSGALSAVLLLSSAIFMPLISLSKEVPLSLLRTLADSACFVCSGISSRGGVPILPSMASVSKILISMYNSLNRGRLAAPMKHFSIM